MNSKSRGFSQSRLAVFGVIAAAGMVFMPTLAASQTAKMAPVVYDSGYYVWLDGSYQSIKLPSYGLGAHSFFINATNGIGGDVGPISVFDPRLAGGGANGGFGYILPHGTLPSLFGSDARIDVGGSFVQAKQSQSSQGLSSISDGSGGFAAGFGGFTPILLNGQNDPFISACAQNNRCGIVASMLTTDYTAWQANLKMSGDHRFGSFVLTPSIAVFAGQNRADQSFAQSFSANGDFPGEYTAMTAVHWTDWGAKFGLAGGYAFMSGTTVALSGSLGVAERHATFAGNDTITPLFAGRPSVSSSVASGANRTAFLANLEASLATNIFQNVALRGFVGLNYDNSVPGISPPSVVGDSRFVPPQVPTTFVPAGLLFAHETSWYAGGGVTVKFSPGT